MPRSSTPSPVQLGLAFDDGSEPAAAPARRARAPGRPPRARAAANPPTPPTPVTPVVSPPSEASSHLPGPATVLAPGSAPVSPAVPALPDLETLARQLEASPDYRVVRRLVPTLLFDRTPAGPLKHLLVLDTETTGLEAGRDQVIELALLRVAIDSATGLPVGQVAVYDGLEDPGRPIPAPITEITGISNDMVKGHRLDEARIAELCQGVDLVIAHNAAFDRPFVEARLPEFARLPWACSFAELDWKARGQGSARLESLALACGWFYSAHRAETDCHALLAVLACPLARFGTLPADASLVEPPHLATGLAVLLASAGRVHHRLQATGAPFEAKDLLKTRGYRWDAPQRVWGITLRSDAELAAELRWLADAVYGGQATRVRTEAVDARQRYTHRAGAPSLQLVEPGFQLNNAD